MEHHTNIVRLKAVRSALSALNETVVFVGGAILSLYADKPVIDVRNTNDIDIIIEILSYKKRAEVEERLRAIGFQNDIESGIVCRYKIQGITIDIMPTNDPSIGFHNIWYPDAFANAIATSLDERTNINIPTAPHYIATKFEAFKSRGNYDGYSSHDFEDIIFVLQNRSTIWEEINTSDEKVLQYLRTEFIRLLQHPRIIDWIEGNVDHNLDSNAGAKIIKSIRALVIIKR